MIPFKVLVLVASLVVVAPTGAATASPLDEIPGAVAGATRIFGASAPPRALAFFVGEFGTAEHARGAVRPLLDELKFGGADAASGLIIGTRPVEAPALGDEAWAYVTDMGETQGTEEVALVFVREGRFLWVIHGLGPKGIMTETRAAADRVPFDGSAGAPDPLYETGGLFDYLPRIEHLPPGYALVQELENALVATPTTT